jgi:transcriptional regulator with XRE-family HTH domain
MSTITGFQIRASRHGLKISAEKLSELSGVSARTIKRMETENDIPNSTVPNLNAIQAALEAAGIEFIGTPADGPGVRLLTKPASKAD